MTFRTRLLLIFTLAVVASVGLVEWAGASATRGRRSNAWRRQRVDALVAQFRKEFDRRRQEIARSVKGIAASDAVINMAIAADPAPFYNEAAGLAAAHDLDLLELVAGDGAIVSSAEWPARFGYKEDWLTRGADWRSRGALSAARGTAGRHDPGAGGGRHRACRRPQAVRGGRAAARPGVPVHPGAAGRNARAALPQPGAAILACGAARRRRPGDVRRGCGR